jgi:hypothetical protein
MPFDIKRLKKFFGNMLMIAIVLTIMILVISFALYILEGKAPMGFLGNQMFITCLTLLILEWLGYIMIHGKLKFNPQPQQRKQRQQPKTVPMRQISVPLKIETDNCSFCGTENPITDMRPFHDEFGNEILVCEKCIRKER